MLLGANCQKSAVPFFFNMWSPEASMQIRPIENRSPSTSVRLVAVFSKPRLSCSELILLVSGQFFTEKLFLCNFGNIKFHDKEGIPPDQQLAEGYNYFGKSIYAKCAWY